MQIVLQNVTNSRHNLKSYYYSKKQERVVISNLETKRDIQIFLTPEEVISLKDILFNMKEYRCPN